MFGIPKHLVVDAAPDQMDSWLANWRWLIGEDKHAVLMAASGDAFVEDDHGTIFWLETGAGTLTRIAGSLEEFEAEVSEEANQKEWLLKPVIETLQQNEPLKSDECYGYTMLPILGGEYQGENRFAVSAAEHFGFTGHVHQQIKDLPDGAQVRLKWI